MAGKCFDKMNQPIASINLTMENGVEYERIFVKKSVREMIVGDKTLKLNLIGDYKFCVRAIIKEGVRFI